MKVLRPNFEKRGGLVTVVTQEIKTGEILMVAFTNEAGYLETLRTGKAVYWSTSRNERWCKGEKSGDLQKVISISLDCDGDALIYHVEQLGAGACHTKAWSCFYRTAGNRQLGEAPEASKEEELASVETEVHPILAQMIEPN